jgi:exodeoxyribonuclease-3
MRITTWNVNGYRAVLKKGFKESVQQLDPDVLCLQEIKAKQEQSARKTLRSRGIREYGTRPNDPVTVEWPVISQK